MTKKKQEDSGPSKGQLETVHRAEYLIESSALDYYLKHEFYDVLLALASMHEQIGDESASNGYGFAMYIYNPSKLSEHFESTATGLGGFGAMINDAIRWIDEEIKTYGGESDFGSKITEVENPRLVDDELEDDPAILKNLMVFAEAWESLSVLFVNMGDTFSTTGWLNVYFEYFPNSDDMPDEIDMAIVEFKGCNQYPGGTLKMFSDEVEKMKAAIEGGPYPECPEPPEECEDDE